MFSSNTDSLGYQSFKGTSWTLVSGMHLGDTIKGLLLVLGQLLILTFGLASWAWASIISNPIKFYKMLGFLELTYCGSMLPKGHMEKEEVLAR